MKSSGNKILIIAVVLLLITNIALVTFMVLGRNKPGGRHSGGRGDMAEMMAKELNMTEQQKKDHKQLKEDHLKNIKTLMDSIRATKTALFALVKDSSINDSIVNTYTQRICKTQSTIDQLTFTHFRRVRNLFTIEQQPKFDEFVQKMMQRGRRDSIGKEK
jgi:Spy/CpxP family protein refolding chaperone